MDYKEKYEQGLECIQEILSSGEEKIKMTLLKERLQPFFPELESEDERIRKWLLDTITQIPNDSIEWDVIEKAKVLAWLEKQGEKPSWSEEDEALLQWTNCNLTEIKERFGEKYGEVGECISWLKSLKTRLS